MASSKRKPRPKVKTGWVVVDRLGWWTPMEMTKTKAECLLMIPHIDEAYPSAAPHRPVKVRVEVVNAD